MKLTKIQSDMFKSIIAKVNDGAGIKMDRTDILNAFTKLVDVPGIKDTIVGAGKYKKVKVAKDAK